MMYLSKFSCNFDKKSAPLECGDQATFLTYVCIKYAFVSALDATAVQKLRRILGYKKMIKQT